MLWIDKNALRLNIKKNTTAFNAFAFADASVVDKKQNVLYGVGENCEILDGTLGEGVGITPLMSEGNKVYFSSSTSKARSFFPFWGKDEDGNVISTMSVLTEHGGIWVGHENGAYWEYIRSFGAKTIAFTAVDGDGELTTALVGYSGVATYDARKGFQTSSIKDGLPVGCYFLGRVFCAATPCTLLFSAPFAPLNFTDDVDGGGKVKLPTDKGEIVALIPFKNKVYIFFERGISLLTPAGSAREFIVKEVGYYGTRILQGSVGAQGNGVWFLAEDGAYRFDGAKCLRVCKNLQIAPKRGGQVCNHAIFLGKYFVTYQDENGEKRGLVIDVESGEGYYAFAPEGLSVYNGDMMCVCDYIVQTIGVNGALPVGEKRVFEASGIDFGNLGLKSLQTLVLHGAGVVNVSVGNGKKSKSFVVDLTKGVETVRVFLRGRKFSLKIELQSGAKVTAVTAYHESAATLK